MQIPHLPSFLDLPLFVDHFVLQLLHIMSLQLTFFLQIAVWINTIFKFVKLQFGATCLQFIVWEHFSCKLNFSPNFANSFPGQLLKNCHSSQPLLQILRIIVLDNLLQLLLPGKLFANFVHRRSKQFFCNIFKSQVGCFDKCFANCYARSGWSKWTGCWR